jgi:peptidoglycan/xylan/chitin deacetylase (PgdA/CDA1 family)
MERTVWLTFDDGPHRTNTPRVLDALDRFGVRALFFLIGRNARRLGGIAEDIHAAGHRVGNHTYTHPDLRELPSADVEGEIRRTEDVLGDLLGRDRVFRPPFGGRNRRVNRVIHKCGYRSILWGVSTRDWDKACQPVAWLEQGLAGIARRRDSIVLMHDIQTSTARNIGDFIERIGEIEGTRFGSPEDL